MAPPVVYISKTKWVMEVRAQLGNKNIALGFFKFTCINSIQNSSVWGRQHRLGSLSVL